MDTAEEIGVLHGSDDSDAQTEDGQETTAIDADSVRHQ
jgi:hypothetical protein